jgi:hypothetical protein
MAHDALVHGVLREIDDEHAIDLDEVDRQVTQ